MLPLSKRKSKVQFAKKKPHHGRAKPTRSRPSPKANEMAAKVIDDLAAPSLPDERKKSLLKGPEEFRDIRKDQPESGRPKK